MPDKILIKDKKLFMFYLLFIISLLLMITAFSQNLFEPKETAAASFNEISYSGESEEYETVIIPTELQEYSYMDTVINLNFMLFASGNENEQILFQTSGDNMGIQLSLKSDNQLTLATGSTIFKGYNTYQLAELIKPDVWYKLNIEISKDNKIRAYVDDENVLDKQDKSLYCLMEQICIGGDGEERSFQGEIDSFSIEYHTFIPEHNPLLIVIKLFSMALSILFAGLIIRQLSLKNFFSSFLSSAKGYKVRFIGSFIIIGFVFAVFYHYALGMYFDFEYPYNTFLFRPEDSFNDFYRKYNLFREGYIPDSLYEPTPLLTLIRYFFSKIGSTIAFAVYILSFLITFICFNRKQLRLSKKIDTILIVFIFTFMSYPFLITIDRSNPETYVFIFLIFFIYFYQKEKIVISSLFLSLAICIKPFPAVFLVLFIADKKYKGLFSAVGFVILIHMLRTLIFYIAGGIHLEEQAMLPLYELNPDLLSGSFSDRIKDFFSASGFIQDSYNQNYVIGNEGLSFGHSLFGLIKIVTGYIHIWLYGHSRGAPDSISIAFYYYLVFTAAAFIMTAIYIRKYEKSFWKKIILLVICMNLLPFVSADYKLLHLFIPLYMFVNSAHEEKHNFIYMILFSLLLIPKAYGHLDMLYPEASMGVIMNPILMIIFAGFIIGSGIRERGRPFANLQPEQHNSLE